MGRLVFSQVVFVGIFCIDLLAPIDRAREYQAQSRSTRFHQQLSAFRDRSTDGLFRAEGLDVEVIRMSCAVSVRALVAEASISIVAPESKRPSPLLLRGFESKSSWRA